MKVKTVTVSRRRKERFYTQKIRVPKTRIDGQKISLTLPHLAEFTVDDIRNVAAVSGKCSLLTVQRLSCLVLAARRIAQHKIEGDVVECGVAAGGSSIVIMRSLLLNDSVRDVYLYDTYKGMPEPCKYDRKTRDITHAKTIYAEKEHWSEHSQKAVRKAIQDKCPCYPFERIRFIEGKVEDTIPGVIPDKIALLHLDTDFYESTKHELEHLFPRLAVGGVLILDDYGAWSGAQRATDEYIKAHDIKIFLAPTDYTQRIGIKES